MTSSVQTLLDQALARHQAGDLDEATRLYRAVIAEQPLNADALHGLGVIARQRGNDDLALKLIELSLAQNSDNVAAWHNRSLVLRALGRAADALQSAQQAIALKPNSAEDWDMLGFLLREKGDYAAARAAHARAVALQPDDAKLLSNYALLLAATNDLAEAYGLMCRLEQTHADFVPQTLGNILKAAGYPDRAIPYYQKSCALLPDNPELRSTEAMARLLIGDFTTGWEIWETRPDLDTRFAHVPRWTGEKVGHLILYEDQGLGDALQCVRFIPLLRTHADCITLHVTQTLRKLFQTAFPDIAVLTLDDAVPQADARMRLLSLPAFFGVDEKTIPAPTAYIAADESWRQPWRARLASVPAPRTGLVWGGNPHHLNDRLRSIPFASLRPILQSGRGHLISLQKGAQKTGVDLSAVSLFDADPYLNDFTDTAGLIAELDLLISADTSVVHLAGAMGKPVWLMLPFDPDWRWLLGREDSPWYPHLRLYRQHAPHDWSQVVERIGNDLTRFIGGDTSVLAPPRWNGETLRHNPLAINLPP